MMLKIYKAFQTNLKGLLKKILNRIQSQNVHVLELIFASKKESVASLLPRIH